jgi:hypothetical protein
VNSLKIIFLYYVVIQITACTKIKNKEAEENSNDTLIKYSYLIVGIKTIHDSLRFFPDATCSLLKTDAGLFCITAKHVLSGINTFTKSAVPIQYDTIGIRYFTKSSNSPKINEIVLGDVRKLFSNKYFYESPDFICFKIPSEFPADSKIYSIENILTKQKPSLDTPQKIIIFGYEWNNKAAKALTSSEEFPIRAFFGNFAKKQNIDPNYPQNDSLNYVIVPEVFGGMSGSPVFFKYLKMTDGKPVEWITFGGVVFGGDSVYKSSWIVRPDISLREIFHPSIYLNKK